MQCVRIWFRKVGRAKYISHLDLMRAMTKAVRRAGIPLWYTEGFNPHPYMTFALPLSLFVESERECVDIKIEGDMSLEEIKNRFDGVMAEGMEVIDVNIPVNDHQEIRYARYEMTLDFEDGTAAANYFYSAQALMTGDDLTAMKKGKQGRKKVLREVVLNPHIFNPLFEQNGTSVKITVDLSAGQQININPSLVIDALSERIGIQPTYRTIVKKSLMIEGFKEFK
ncbi:hypothetical protein SDC9_106771 [bioreactor metagenome]|uniref:DUF2344 domain-containing protein n=1 Tax=bioreactor metagenome TaxID=1076179 RepID=A0A645B3C4_9ZZZZ